MNAYSRTATDLAAALLGQPRIAQDVIVCTKAYYGGQFRAKVLVDGEYYTVRTSRALEQLENGLDTPESLDLDVYEPEDDK